MTQLTQPETIPGQLGSVLLGSSPEAVKVELKYSRQPIKVSQSQLIFWWEQSFINTAHFIRFALMVERVGEDGLEEFDIAQFCSDWVGTKANGDEKMVTLKQVMAEIQHLQQKGAAHVQTTVQMSLDLSGGYENAG